MMPVWLLLSSSSVGLAQSGPCQGREYRQFDFWIGEWQVTDSTGRVIGENRITSEYGGCALREQWQARGRHAGSSLNIYDAGRRVWHQTWVDTNGLLLLLDGGLQEGRMVLSGATTGADGTTTTHRIMWWAEPGNPDLVHQVWEQSLDEGRTWKVVFHGRYVRRR
ncbi:MAG: hypothetical protein ACT4PM_14895 [Gemmatimonadales bacterium]